MKSNIKRHEMAEVGEKIVEFFGENIEKLARETKFVQRSSLLGGLNFLKALVFGYLEKPHASLTQLAQVCLDLGVKISAQGVDDRIGVNSVEFLKAVLTQAMIVFQNHLSLPLAVLRLFSAIFIVDSSILALPEHMREDYPGCGGGGPQASLKIQLVFEFLHGNLRQIAIQAGRSADQSYRDYLNIVTPGSLTLVDLGYFCLDSLRKIYDRNAFFLIRYLYPTALLTPEGERIQLLALLHSEIFDQIDRPVLLGCQARHRIPCRLIALRLPPSVAEERRRKAIEKARTHGKTPSQDYLFLLGWTIFLTNIPLLWLSASQLASLYRIRWQIELIFKLWKSYCGIQSITRWRKDRILTELYVKMIAIVLSNFLVAPLRIPDTLWSNRELSIFQAHQILSRFASRFSLCLSSLPSLIELLSTMLTHFQLFALKQKRRTKPNVCQLLDSLA